MNFLKRTSTIVGIGIVILLGLGFWAYKIGVFSTSSNQIQSGSISYKGQNGKSALDLLKGKYPGKVETQIFTSGETVSSINGVKPGSNEYWSFTVNGTEPTVSAVDYTTKDADTIEWKLKQVNTSL